MGKGIPVAILTSLSDRSVEGALLGKKRKVLAVGENKSVLDALEKLASVSFLFLSFMWRGWNHTVNVGVVVLAM